MRGTTYDVWAKAHVERYPTPKACQFVSGDDFLRLAMQAFLAAGRSLVPPDGERWNDDGISWANAEHWFDLLWRELGERLRREARKKGHLVEVPCSEETVADLVAQFDARSAQRRAGLPAPAGAGRSPAVEGHGCPAPAVGAPAPAVAVGSASSALPGADITTPDNPLFCASEAQGLPGDFPCPDTHPALEETP